MIKKVFISGPMRIAPGLNFEMFDEVATNLRGAGYIVISPADIFRARNIDPYNPPEMTKEFIAECLCVAIKELSECDYYYPFDLWAESSGRDAEEAAAKAMGIPNLSHVLNGVYN